MEFSYALSIMLTCEMIYGKMLIDDTIPIPHSTEFAPLLVLIQV